FSYLGWAVPAGDGPDPERPIVFLDRTAQGEGWFIDPTPADSAEFSGVMAPTEFVAAPGSPAFGHMDLLTGVSHELGHLLGLDDLDPAGYARDVMTATLSAGERRLPGALDARLVRLPATPLLDADAAATPVVTVARPLVLTAAAGTGADFGFAF